jgi:glutaredoxin
MKMKAIHYVGIGVALLILIVLFSSIGSSGEYDEFATCLTESGAKMYGAYWCPHCSDQKKAFGASWKNVDYIECSLPNGAGQTSECSSAGITSYPTWEFSDGNRVSGNLAFEQLASITGCTLPQE